MKNIFKKLKSSTVTGLLSLIFTNEARAQSMPMPMYGPFPSPTHILMRLLPFLIAAFLIFVAAPIAGLVWYRKRGGTKKWPRVVVWILAILFVVVLTALIILLYSSLS